MKERSSLRLSINSNQKVRYAREFFENGVYTPERLIYLGNATYSVDGTGVGIDSVLAQRVIGGLIHLNRSNTRPIKIIMNTPGGEITDGYAIYDAIRSSRSPVDIEVFGEACSMGSIILQSARYRILHENTLFMIHEGTFKSENVITPRQQDSWAAWCKKDNQRMYRIFAERSCKREKFWEKLCTEKHDVIFDAKKAVKLGLADDIVKPSEWTKQY